MPQTFQVLQCYSCETFQVHQVKKVNKWTCKVCNEKQSIKKVYGQGSAADCRKKVQTLNMIRGDKEMSLPVIMPPDAYSDYSESGEDSPYNTTKQPAIVSGRNGRWAIFAEPKESDSDQDEGGHDTFTTSRTEFEQVSKKLKKEKSKVKSLHSRVSGFHSIVSKQGQGRRHVTTSLSTSTYTVSPDHAYSSKDPYSSVGEDIESMLQEHRGMSVSSSKSLDNVDDVHGHYRKINDDSANVEPHPQLSVSVGNSSRHLSDSQDVVDLPMSSKWNKYLSVADQLSAEETSD